MSADDQAFLDIVSSGLRQGRVLLLNSSSAAFLGAE